jgi:sugar phosphate isomerase/epimerase
MKLGLDSYSIRSQNWDVFRQVDFCVQAGFDLLHTGLSAFSSRDERYLKQVRDYAGERGIALEIGMGCISPTTATFREINTSCGLPVEPGMSPAEVVVDHMRQMLLICQQMGSPALHTFVGHKPDRLMGVPIEAHIASTVASCRAVRDLALELGVMIAIENHAGDLRASELRDLIEEAGPEYVGVCFDSGGTFASAAESIFVALDYLAPYVIQSHLRDSAVWAHPRGAAVQSVAIGEGSIGFDAWAQRFKTECPRAAFTLEILTGGPPRVANYLEAEFWEAYPQTPASEFAQFLKLVRAGQPFMGGMVIVERGTPVPPEYQAALVAQQRYDLERSARYCCDVLGIGE